MVDKNLQNSTGPIKPKESNPLSTPINNTKELQTKMILNDIDNERAEVFSKVYWGKNEDIGKKQKKNFIYSHSWAMPTMPVLREIQNFVGQEKVLEIGAGTGLWCGLLETLGVNIDAVDNQNWDKNTIKFEEMWCEVEKKTMDEIKEMIPHYKIIMMVWPTNRDDSAYEYLKLFTENGGEKVILIRDYKKEESLEELETGTFYFHKYLQKYYNEPIYWYKEKNPKHILPKLTKESLLILAERNSIPLDNEEKFYLSWENPTDEK